MFEDYKNEVHQCYLRKKEKELLHAYLQKPTTRKLKKECLRIFTSHSKKDERTLRLFFDPNNRFEDLEDSIKDFNVERFRPLLSFIQEGRNVRDEEPVKLLAWLIGFDTYKEWKERQINIAPTTDHDPNINDGSPDSPTIPIDEIIINPDQPNKPVVISNPIDKEEINWWDLSNNWKTWTVTICCIVLSFVAFAYYKFKDNQQCMYWNGNEFKQISCEQNLNQPTTFALDEQRLNDLKRITRPDSITYQSIGKVWYAKINGKVEFYTAGGNHPTEANKRLLPITAYMIDKYIVPLKKSPN